MMKLGIVLNTKDTETVWNGLRLGIEALTKDNEVTMFLLGSGVEVENIKDETFNVAEALERFRGKGGNLLACGTCLKSRNQKADVCSISTMSQLVAMISDSDKVVTLG